VISLVGVGIRHWFNIRHLEKRSALVLPLSLLLLAALIFSLRPGPKLDLVDEVTFPSTAAIMPVIEARCVSCHAAKPDHPGFAAAPLGVLLESDEAVNLQASVIYNAVIVKRSMPLANITQMSDEERDLIARWYAGRMRSKN